MVIGNAVALGWFNTATVQFSHLKTRMVWVEWLEWVECARISFTGVENYCIISDRTETRGGEHIFMRKL